MFKEQKTKTVVFGLVVILGILWARPVAAYTVIPYTIDVWTPPMTVYNGWTYIEEIPGTLWLTANPSGGIIAEIDLPTDTDDGGLVASRHDLPDYSLHNQGFIQLEYSSLSFEITGVPEGPDLCLEVEFDDAGNVHYEMGIDVWHYDGEYFFGTWFEIEGSGPYYETPVPDGVSVAEGALGFYSDGSLVFPYFMDTTGSVVSPFVVWNVSGITGTHGYRVDNDFEGTTTTGGTITASVNLEQVVHGSGNPLSINPLVGWIYMPPGVPDIGYSLDEENLLYFFSYGPVLNYNFTTGLLDTEGPEGLIYANWPFIYELDTGDLWFAWPPVDGLWVYHFSTSQWLISSQIIP